MTHIEDIVCFQREFDRKHGWLFEGDFQDKKFLDRLQYATIAIAGEVGEFSNILKKMLREKNIDDLSLVNMREEIIDIFIYLLILSITLRADLTKGYYEKMRFNEQKYKKFEV